MKTRTLQEFARDTGKSAFFLYFEPLRKIFLVVIRDAEEASAPPVHSLESPSPDSEFFALQADFAQDQKDLDHDFVEALNDLAMRVGKKIPSKNRFKVRK